MSALSRWKSPLRCTFSFTHACDLLTLWSCTIQHERSTHTRLFLSSKSNTYPRQFSQMGSRFSGKEQFFLRYCKKRNWRWWRGTVFLHDSRTSHKFFTPMKCVAERERFFYQRGKMLLQRRERKGGFWNLKREPKLCNSGSDAVFSSILLTYFYFGSMYIFLIYILIGWEENEKKENK